MEASSSSRAKNLPASVTNSHPNTPHHRRQRRPCPDTNGGQRSLSHSGFYDGLLSYRRKEGQLEFLITVFKIARDPLLTLGHEFAHMVEDLRLGSVDKQLGPPDDAREKKFDEQAGRDLLEFGNRTGE